MKNILKNITTVVICLVSISTSAQDLLTKISSDASFVAVFNGENTFNDVSILDVENSLLFKEVMKEVFHSSDMKKPKSFSDIGINVNSKLYFSIENQTDIDYYYFLLPIKDFTKFNTFAKSSITQDNELLYSISTGLNKLIYDNSSRLVWNDEYAVLIMSNYTGNAFEADYYYGWSDYDYGTEAVDAVVHEAIEEEPDIQEESDESFSDRIARENKEHEEQEKAKETAWEKKESLKEIKKSLFLDSALTTRTQLFFTDNLKSNFAPKNVDTEAVISFWYNGMDIANFPNPYSLSMYNRYRSSADIFGLQSLYKAESSGHLYLEDDKIKLVSNLKFSEKLKQSADKIYNSKLDRKFCNYLPENTLAYTTFSLSTEDLLKETATVSKDYFATTSEFEYNQEVSAYIDLIEIMLDEEAISELVTGDVVMLLNDLTTKEVKYKTWEYDDNFNETQVTKTKQELLPEFTIMMGSQNEEILTKLFKLSMKHKFLTSKESYFVSHEQFRNDLPFDMYLCFKDGILFFTNSKTQLKNILNGKAEPKINKKQRKHIMKNVGTMYIDMEQIITKTLNNAELSKELHELNHFTNDVKKVMLTSSYKNGKISSEIYITIPEHEENSSKYLLNLIDKIITLQTNH